MKNIKYLMFGILFLFFDIFYVNASCSTDEIMSLVSEANKIKVTYKHKGIVETVVDDINYTNYYAFDVTIKNVSDDFYISIPGVNINLIPIDGVIDTNLNNGDWLFQVYSNKCDVIINEIKVHLPKFNLYSLDSLCEGIDGDDFALCGKYYEYDISYDTFKEQVDKYRITHNIDKITNEDGNDLENIVDASINFIILNKYYFAVGISILILLLVIILLVKKKRKRGVLE